MRIVTSVSTMQRVALRWKRRGTSIGFVPTMGYLHEGHISLVKKARQSVGKRGVVVVSIYVNPTQFAPTEDLGSYPRDLPRDKKLCRDAGVDVLFAKCGRSHSRHISDYCFSRSSSMLLTPRRRPDSLKEDAPASVFLTRAP